jgi:CRP/FNR family transcriptional regulator, cyclic AMP receptor protein
MSYDPNIALSFFKQFGVSESVKQGEIFFVQGEKANRLLLQYNKMYLLVKGEVSIQVLSKEVAIIKPGQIFGELTPLIQSVRSAAAIAELPCRLISLNEKQFVSGLKQNPEFALMMMGALVMNLRQAASAVGTSLLVPENNNNKQMYTLDSKIRRSLVQQLGEAAIIRVLKEHTIFQEGGAGMLMYVILEGQVAAIIGDKVVEHSGPGGIIGEVALVDQKRRMASVVAETNCALLAINRQTFLELVKTQPDFGLALLRSLASRLYLYRTGRSFTPSHSLFTGF